MCPTGTIVVVVFLPRLASGPGPTTATAARAVYLIALCCATKMDAVLRAPRTANFYVRFGVYQPATYYFLMCMQLTTCSVPEIARIMTRPGPWHRQIVSVRGASTTAGQPIWHVVVERMVLKSDPMGRREKALIRYTDKGAIAWREQSSQ